MLRYFVCFIAILFSGVATAGLNEGYQAYDNKNYEKAFKEFYPLAKNGDVEAQFVVSMMYDRGKGVEEDPAKTIYWLTKAAEQGHVYGQSLLGAMYYVGRNVKKDNVATLYWFKRSAMGGRPESQYFVGNMYYEGEKGVLFDWVEAYAWLSAAAEQGIEPAKQKKMILEEKLGSGRLAEAKKLAKKYHELYVQPFINRPNKALQLTPKNGANEHHR